MVLQIPAIVVAVIATTSTSCYEPARVDRVVIDDGAAWAGIVEKSHDARGDEHEVTRWARSDDAGRTWFEASASERDAPATSQACSSAACWRTISGDRVEVDDGTGWRPSFSFSDEELKQQELAAQSSCDFSRRNTFGSIAVVDADVPIVLVIMGTQGILRHEGGTWERVGVLDSVPAPMPGPTWLTQVPLWTASILSASAVLPAAGAFQRLWFRPRRRWFMAATIAVVGGFALLLVAGAARIFSGGYYPVWAALSVGFGAGVFVLSVVIVVRPPASTNRFGLRIESKATRTT